MFSAISLNPNKGEGKRSNEVAQKNLKTNYDLGRPEWHQKWKSENHYEYIERDLNNNKCKLNKPYLKPDYSNFELIHDPSKEPFKTSNKRDFKVHPDHRVNFISKKGQGTESKVELKFDQNSYFKTTSQRLLNDPKYQIPKQDLSKVHFKYEPENVHPILGYIIDKKSDNNWAFDYWNKEKPKPRVSNDKPQVLVYDLKRIRDPITNRFLN